MLQNTCGCDDSMLTSVWFSEKVYAFRLSCRGQ